MLNLTSSPASTNTSQWISFLHLPLHHKGHISSIRCMTMAHTLLPINTQSSALCASDFANDADSASVVTRSQGSNAVSMILLTGGGRSQLVVWRLVDSPSSSQLRPVFLGQARLQSGKLRPLQGIISRKTSKPPASNEPDIPVFGNEEDNGGCTEEESENDEHSNGASLTFTLIPSMQPQYRMPYFSGTNASGCKVYPDVRLMAMQAVILNRPQVSSPSVQDQHIIVCVACSNGHLRFLEICLPDSVSGSTSACFLPLPEPIDPPEPDGCHLDLTTLTVSCSEVQVGRLLVCWQLAACTTRGLVTGWQVSCCADPQSDGPGNKGSWVQELSARRAWCLSGPDLWKADETEARNPSSFAHQCAINSVANLGPLRHVGGPEPPARLLAVGGDDGGVAVAKVAWTPHSQSELPEAELSPASAVWLDYQCQHYAAVVRVAALHSQTNCVTDSKIGKLVPKFNLASLSADQRLLIWHVDPPGDGTWDGWNLRPLRDLLIGLADPHELVVASLPGIHQTIVDGEESEARYYALCTGSGLCLTELAVGKDV
ncbi:unnamed protein product [Protopolystoma xenopodis]|uniref:Uncharacterized protein n=1 Tax=Protopolystoma xenopodis TaxID=117903 RepID=A0A3S5AVW9_9PLAT|nr:unnamed protein product [Protopolystoma xenopodis]